jgi:hypothetical protein
VRRWSSSVSAGRTAWTSRSGTEPERVSDASPVNARHGLTASR